jgi:hypothetical protein
MKYIEELEPGDCFELSGNYYVVSRDFKNNGHKMCLSIVDGFSKWISPETITNPIDVFTTDKDSHIIAIKERKKQNDLSN